VHRGITGNFDLAVSDDNKNARFRSIAKLLEAISDRLYSDCQLNRPNQRATVMNQRALSIISRPLSLFLCIPIAAFLIGCQNVDLNQINNQIRGARPLDNTTIVAGLKKALEIGTINSVLQTSQVGGFSDNELLKITTPPQLQKLSSTLTKLGMGSFVKQFELQMNRAAESASKEAKQVFLSSISKMTLTDGLNILAGPDDAATQFFKRSSSKELSKKFRPIIANAMSKIGFYDDYKTLLNTYDALPFTSKPDVNIENYILGKTLDGLFSLVAKEEKKIRRDPAARVTELLQRVFAGI